MDRMDMLVNGDAKVFWGTTFDVLVRLSLQSLLETSHLEVIIGNRSRDRVPVLEYVLDNSPRTIYTKLIDHRIPNEQLGTAERELLMYMGKTRTQFKMFWNSLNGRQQNELKIDYLTGKEPRYR